MLFSDLFLRGPLQGQQQMLFLGLHFFSFGCSVNNLKASSKYARVQKLRCGFGTCIDITCQNENPYFPHEIMTSNSWPCIGPPKKRSVLSMAVSSMAVGSRPASAIVSVTVFLDIWIAPLFSAIRRSTAPFLPTERSKNVSYSALSGW